MTNDKLPALPPRPKFENYNAASEYIRELDDHMDAQDARIAELEKFVMPTAAMLQRHKERIAELEREIREAHGLLSFQDVALVTHNLHFMQARKTWLERNTEKENQCQPK